MTPADWYIVNQMAFSYIAVSHLYNRLAWEIVSGWFYL